MHPIFKGTTTLVILLSASCLLTSCSFGNKNKVGDHLTLDVKDTIHVNQLDTFSINYSQIFDDINWGTTQSGESVNHYISFTNDTLVPITIHKVSAGGGGCWVDYDNGNLWGTTVAPNERIVLNIRLLTKSKRGTKIKIVRFYFKSTGEELIEKNFKYFGYINYSEYFFSRKKD